MVAGNHLMETSRANGRVISKGAPSSPGFPIAVMSIIFSSTKITSAPLASLTLKRKVVDFSRRFFKRSETTFELVDVRQKPLMRMALAVEPATGGAAAPRFPGA